MLPLTGLTTVDGRRQRADDDPQLRFRIYKAGGRRVIPLFMPT